MKQLISTNGFNFDEELKIWYRDQYQGIAYSDGDEVENRVGNIIKNASDISVMSDELKQQCMDWPTHYYLNKDRVNLLRPFTQQLKNAQVLEIGAGCGAITRFLGECQANVFALEGSKRRASIAKSRCRDLPNVEVVSENFTEFNLNHQFDVVTLVGVLEYANMFTPGENPAQEMLKKVRRFLKPNGVLIIAIENQVGLKYYAGAREDHLGVRMVGVEGLYKKDGPQTYGKTVLTTMLKQTGFANAKFIAPFPDYKLPVALITEAGFTHPEFKAADLVSQSVTKDRQLCAPFAFSLENAWGPLFDNQVALDLSNSFLITASTSESDLNKFNEEKEGNLAFYYSTSRIASYCKETIFKNNLNNNLNVVYKSLNPFKNSQNSTNLDQNVHITYAPKETASYYANEYESFSQMIQRALKVSFWKYSDIAIVVEQYLYALETLSQSKGFTKPFNKYAKLPASFFDAITHNVLIHKKNQTPVLIDEEWSANFEPTIGYLLYRSIIACISELTITAPSAEVGVENAKILLEGIFKALNSELTAEDLEQYESFEIPIQKQVSGLKHIDSGWWYKFKQFNSTNGLDLVEQLIPLIGSNKLLIDDLNQHIKNLILEINARNDQITLLTNQNLNFNIEISQKNEQINQLNIYIHSLLSSKSWRFTKPFRHLVRVIKGENNLSFRQQLSIIIHALWKILPLSNSIKLKIRNLAFLTLPFLFSHTNTYKNFIESKNANEPKDIIDSHDIDSIADLVQTDTRRVLIVDHEAASHDSQSHLIQLVKTLNEDFRFNVDLVCLGSKPLLTEYSQWATIHFLSEKDQAETEALALAKQLQLLGHKSAIVNSVFCGTFIKTLVENKIECTVLVNDLSGVVEDYILVEQAQLIANYAKQVVFPSNEIAKNFNSIAAITFDKQLIKPHGINQNQKKKFELLDNSISNDINENTISLRHYTYDLLDFIGLGLYRISVIIPNYNYERYLSDRIKSITNQDYPIFEIIFLDDKSSDLSIQLAKDSLSSQSIDFQIIPNTENSGSVFKQWKKGCDLAIGDFIWIAEADDSSLNNFISETCKGFSNPKVVFSYCGSQKIDKNGNVISDNYTEYVHDIDPEKWLNSFVANKEDAIGSFCIKNIIPNVSSVIFKTKNIKSVLNNNFEEIMSYRLAGDWLVYLMLLKEGYLAFTPAATNLHRHHQSGVTIGMANFSHLSEIHRVQKYVQNNFSLNDKNIDDANKYLEKIALLFEIPLSELKKL